ncbi:hypothetical protein L195_g037255, partial [Trifolium pratense]
RGWERKIGRRKPPKAESHKSKASFNEVAFKVEWLTLNTEARQAMAVEEEESSQR